MKIFRYYCLKYFSSYRFFSETPISWLLHCWCFPSGYWGFNHFLTLDKNALSWIVSIYMYPDYYFYVVSNLMLSQLNIFSQIFYFSSLGIPFGSFFTSSISLLGWQAVKLLTISFILSSLIFKLCYGRFGLPVWLSSKEPARSAEDAGEQEFDPWVR